MGRSNSRSHSSRSKSRSPSSSRSRSHSRKKRYSSRSRSRTHSRSRSRERVYNRDVRRDYRNNRGMRRPYGFRGRARGYYQGGGGRYYRGGYRPMWNRRYSRSPRRDRSRSRSPKRRSASSQRSRSRSQRSYKSSQSPRSSSSRSSSCYSKSPVKKSRGSQEEKKQKTERAEKLQSPKNEKSGDEHKDAFDPSEPLDELGKELDLHGDSWAGLSAYDNSPRSPCSPSPVASPPSQSSSQSDCPILSVVHSGKDTLSQNSHSIVHTPEKSGSGSGGNGSTRYSPSQNSPLHIPSQKSPAKNVLSQNPSCEEGRSHYLYTDTAEQEPAKGVKHLKRYPDEELSLFPIERVNIREKESQKDRTLDKSKKEEGKSWDHRDTLDYFLEKDPVKAQFLSISESEDIEEVEDYRQFRKSVLADQGKGFSSSSHWISEEDGTKFKSKAAGKASKEGEKVRESKAHKVSSKNRHKDDDKGSDRSMIKKDPKSPDPVMFEKMKDPLSCSFPLHQNVEVREKAVFREESPLRIKIVATESHHPEVKLRMISVPLDDTRTSSMINDRLLASTLVHSVKSQKDFRSIFDHMKVSFSSKTSPESFIYHVVSLVQFVKEHYFKGDGQTLSERFAGYLKVAKDPASRPKSPEIHRRIDLSLDMERKQASLQNEDKDLDVKVEPVKYLQVEKKLKSSLIDVRGESERRRKGRSKERGDSKGSRESSDSRKREKPQKELKELKFFKHDNKRRKDHEPSPPPSDDDEKDTKKESRDEEFKGPVEPKEYPGFPGISRPRGTFFRIRGRGRARGVFAGTSTAPVNTAPTFQKRSKEEEWDPEYTPKSKKYFLHDDRDDGVDYWARRARGRGNFQRGRGRFPFKKSGSSPKWTHDKYQGDGLVDDEDEAIEDRRKDEKE
ncbi:bcl-2-associated transcription factor 1 isoform X2 [Pseudophryne corroboree]|uniref:bcl-2-associated transcription factor 1 isoform X2 n=1 Tax=Pseudophryne corroboree TaxID=495146 RepID=UPI003081D416